MATILKKKHSRHSIYAFQIQITKSRYNKHVAPVLPSRFVPKSTPGNEPLSSELCYNYRATKKKKKKMEKIEGQANFSLTC